MKRSFAPFPTRRGGTQAGHLIGSGGREARTAPSWGLHADQWLPSVTRTRGAVWPPQPPAAADLTVMGCTLVQTFVSFLAQEHNHPPNPISIG